MRALSTIGPRGAGADPGCAWTLLGGAPLEGALSASTGGQAGWRVRSRARPAMFVACCAMALSGSLLAMPESGPPQVHDARASDARAGDARAGDARAGDARAGEEPREAEKRDVSRPRVDEPRVVRETRSKTRASPAEGPVDLNAAGVDELCTLPGIGPKKAEAILALRERRPFTRLTQLLLVRGIGKKTLERIRPLVVIRPPPRGRGVREEPARGVEAHGGGGGGDGRGAAGAAKTLSSP